MTDNINPNVELFSTAILNLYYTELYISADFEFKNNKVVSSLTDIFKNKCMMLLNVFSDKKPENEKYQADIYKSILGYCASKITDPHNKDSYKIDLHNGMKNVNRAIISEIVKEIIPAAYHKLVNDAIEQEYFYNTIKKVLHRCNIYIFTDNNVSYIIDKRDKYSIEILQDQFYKLVMAVKNSIVIDILNKNRDSSCKKSDIIQQLMSVNSTLRTENEKLKNTIKFLLNDKKSPVVQSMLSQISTATQSSSYQQPTPTPKPTQSYQQTYQHTPSYTTKNAPPIEQKYSDTSVDNLVEKYLAPTQPIIIENKQPQPQQQHQQQPQFLKPSPTSTVRTSEHSQESYFVKPLPPQQPTPLPQPTQPQQPTLPQQNQQQQPSNSTSSVLIDNSLFDEILGDADFVDDDFDDKEPIDDKPKNKSLALADNKSNTSAPIIQQQSLTQQSSAQQSSTQQSSSQQPSDDVDYI